KLRQPFPFQQDAEQVISRNFALKHHNIDQKHGHRVIAIAHGHQEHFLKHTFFKFGAVHKRIKWFQIKALRRHDGRNTMLVNKLSLAITTSQYGGIIEPRHDAPQLDAFDQKHGHGGFGFAERVQEEVL